MSMEDRDGFIWMDGELIPWRAARAHVLSHTLHHGTGVFEGVRAYATTDGTAIFRLAEHTRRFFRSAHILQMSLPYDAETVSAAQEAVVRKNKLRECYIRPIAFHGGEVAGVSAKGNSVHVAIAAWPWETYLGADAKRDGIRVKTSSYSRHHINSLMIHAKASGHYINSVLANQEAVQQGYQEALMLDTQGYAAEGSTENLFLVRNGALHTPEVANVLEGITRDSIMMLARDRGIEVVERRIARDEVYCADEAFFTGTAAEVTPIRELDNRPIGNGAPGPITQTLQQDYFATVSGRNPRHRDWLHLVPHGPDVCDEQKRRS
jgi:branched-chain amino acid aminotransferase